MQPNDEIAMALDAKEIDVVEKRLAAVTAEWSIEACDPGEYFDHDQSGNQIYPPAFHIVGLESLGNHECGAMDQATAELVFHSRSDLTRVIAKCKALEKERDGLRAIILQLQTKLQDPDERRRYYQFGLVPSLPYLDISAFSPAKFFDDFSNEIKHLLEASCPKWS